MLWNGTRLLKTERHTGFKKSSKEYGGLERIWCCFAENDNEMQKLLHSCHVDQMLAGLAVGAYEGKAVTWWSHRIPLGTVFSISKKVHDNELCGKLTTTAKKKLWQMVFNVLYVYIYKYSHIYIYSSLYNLRSHILYHSVQACWRFFLSRIFCLTS